MIDFFEKYTIFKKKTAPLIIGKLKKKQPIAIIALWWSQTSRLEGTSSACSDRFVHCERLVLVFTRDMVTGELELRFGFFAEVIFG